MYYKKNSYNKPKSYKITYLSYATTTIVSALQKARRKFGLEINIGKYKSNNGGGMDEDCSRLRCDNNNVFSE